LGDYSLPPFKEAAKTPVLHKAFDQLVGKSNWNPRNSLGTFPIRFPSPEDPGDAGWHVDAGFPGEYPDDFLSWRINYKSKGRALLMLFLFSDMGENDAPTKILEGSHLDVANILHPAGEKGLSFMELAQKLPPDEVRNIILATGKAGTVYLCHPFLVHAAQAHRGTAPRFMAQPPLYAKVDIKLYQKDCDYSPVEQAIRIGINVEK
jgi:hypothetical protein